MSVYRNRKNAENKPEPRTAFASCVYVAIIAIVSFLLAGFVMAQVDLYGLLGLNRTEIPFVNIPGQDIPQLVLHLALAVLIFFILQPLVVVVTGLFSRKESEDQFSQAPPNPWDR
jgi:TRAP-type C4-dicarboxylate transport system permease small subunit